LALAGIVETEHFCANQWGDRAIALFNVPWGSFTGYRFISYNYPHDSDKPFDIHYDYL